MANDVKREIIEHLGVLSTNQNGWSKDVNIVSWCDRDPVYDIRQWSPDHLSSGRGVTLTEDEMKALAEVLAERIRSGKEL